MAQVRLVRVIPSMHAHLCLASCLFSPRLSCSLPRLTVLLPALPDVHLSAQREVQVQPPVRLPLGDRGHIRLRDTPHKDLGVVQVGDQILRFSELVDLLRLAQVLKEGFLMFVVLELLDQLFDFVLACCILLLDCRKRYSRFCNPLCCYRFLRNFSNRSMVPKMILRLGFVNLVDHIAGSILVRHVAFSELSAPSGRAHPEFSHIPLS